MRLPRILTPRVTASAHCDLPCGVYDPAQARIEAESVKAICEKYQANTDPEFRTRALIIKEQRAELVKHHLWVLWTDYFKAAALREVPAPATSCSTRPPSSPARRGAKGGDRPGEVADELLAQDRRDLEDLLGDQAGVTPRSGLRRSGRYVPRTCRPSSPWCTSWPSTSGRREQCHLTAEQLARGPVRPAAGAVRPRRGRRRRRAGRLRALVPQLLHLGRRARHLPGGPLRPPGRPGHRRGPAAAGHPRRDLRRARLPAAGMVDARLEPGRRSSTRSIGRRADARVGAVPARRQRAAPPRGQAPTRAERRPGRTDPRRPDAARASRRADERG